MGLIVVFLFHKHVEIQIDYEVLLHYSNRKEEIIEVPSIGS